MCYGLGAMERISLREGESATAWFIRGSHGRDNVVGLLQKRLQAIRMQSSLGDGGKLLR